ncbi:hypothetical protein [Bifidobacterium psychraerophilum]|jgi:hypothetical protein|uniref:hypothetical protein n=1 Tax=Bifidobacterium psychraerophilum TaxID=218140 RepID=UPI0023F54259|nr:hypothetical protein [Bifidobacterium psychraerophilum]MCI1659546.1 hypothetical protein [Bifidobacterium psychraerophilum]MCI1804486.1 hypothetical protein [Bifidobacterium psychraerophilum]MCI2176358.1 hypothetical protein [Bifidobacterium psychraerophilum]MCI2181168.1 hypothetical protein [Bifidobacterium psychraerophilum]
MIEIPDTVTIPEAMELLRCSSSHVEHLMYSGKLTYNKQTKQHTLIDAESQNKLFDPY